MALPPAPQWITNELLEQLEHHGWCLVRLCEDGDACLLRTSSLMLDAMSASAMRLFAAAVFSDATASERVALLRRFCIAPRFERFVLTVLIDASSAVMAAGAVAWVVMLLVSTARVAAVLFVRATARMSPLFVPICNVMDVVDPLG